MYKMLYFYKRRSGLTHEAFCEHWRNVHAEVIKGIPNIDRLLVRYVQHALTPDNEFGGADGLTFDGCSEAWFASRDAMKTVYSDPYFLSEVVGDEPNFIDMSATRWAIIDDAHVAFEGSRED